MPLAQVYDPDAISIHALRKDSDLPTLSGCGLFHVFQSTLSVRRATKAANL